jgi:hypothetical protein
MYSFTLFSDGYLDQYLKYRLAQIKEETVSASMEDLNQPDYSQGLVERFSVQPGGFRFDEAFATHYEKEIPAEYHPQAFLMRSGEVYKRQVIVYHIPFDGSVELLKYVPNTHILWTEEVSEERTPKGTNICFEVINFNNDPERLKQPLEEFKQKAGKQLGNINSQVSAFNESLPAYIDECINAREAELKKQNSVLEGLGVPIRE